MRYFSIVLFFICFFSFAIINKSFAAKENLELMRVTVPMGWIVEKSTGELVVLKNEKDNTSFIYKKVPVHFVNLEAYARAVMKAYGGFNFTKRTNSIYYFDYMHGYSPAWSLVSYYKGLKNIFSIQSGIGESTDFAIILDSIELK